LSVGEPKNPERLDITLRLPQTAYKGLGLLAESAEKLDTLQASFSSMVSSTNLSSVYPILSEKTGLPESQVALLLETLLSLSSLKSKVRTSADHLVELIAETADNSGGRNWKDDYSEKWKHAKTVIARAIDAIQNDEFFVGLSKSRQLTFAHQNILTESNIITELRPVFNTAGDKVLQMVLTHYLLIEYTDGIRSNRIQLALDAADIEDLKDRCERAEKKTATLKQALENQPWQMTIPRETTHSD